MAISQEQKTLKHQTLLTFRRDLPELIKQQPGKWVFYHGDRRVGIAKTDLELHELCDRLGIDPEERIIVPIDWEPPYEVEIP